MKTQSKPHPPSTMLEKDIVALMRKYDLETASVQTKKKPGPGRIFGKAK